ALLTPGRQGLSPAHGLLSAVSKRRTAVFGGRLGRITLSGALATVLAFGAPAAAQTYSDGYLFLQAVEKKDLQKADELLGKPGSTLINSRDLTNGRSGLHIAADRRDVTWIAYLLENGANPNIADRRGVTPLMRASQLGFYEGIEQLVAAGARVDVSNSTGETPLILAVHRRDTSLMRLLLKAGADPGRTDNTGRSARDYAEIQGGDSLVLAEIARNDANAGGDRASTAVYGPSF